MRQLLPQPLYIYIWEKTLQKISTRAKFEKKEEEKKIIQPNVFQYEKKRKNVKKEIPTIRERVNLL